jgi:hypothetical protein
MILASNTQQHKEKHPKKRRREKIKQTYPKGRKQKGLGLGLLLPGKLNKCEKQSQYLVKCTQSNWS